MPVKLSTSSVLRWPDRQQVDGAAREWAKNIGTERREVRRIGYFGSYARAEWGVGSDLDILIIVDQAVRPFHQRALDWDVTGLPVPTDVLVYSQAEWHALAEERGRFYLMIEQSAVWIYERPAG